MPIPKCPTGSSFCVAVLDLPLHRVPAGVIEHRVAEGAREQQRHQVLEHRAAPGQQRLACATSTIPGAAQREPVLGGHIAFRDRHQARETAFARQQIVVAAEFPRAAHRIADAEQFALPRRRESAC